MRIATCGMGSRASSNDGGHALPGKNRCPDCLLVWYEVRQPSCAPIAAAAAAAAAAAHTHPVFICPAALRRSS